MYEHRIISFNRRKETGLAGRQPLRPRMGLSYEMDYGKDIGNAPGMPHGASPLRIIYN